jgi:hypothetical protein
VTGALNGVATVSKKSAWAVGATGNPATPRVLLLHWHGRAWSRLTRPSILTAPGELEAVTVVNSRDAWAAGFAGSPAHTTHSLLLHWNGKTWSQVTRPAPVKNGALSGVTASAKGGFAVGTYDNGPAAVNYWSLTFRLKGSKWSRVTARTNNTNLDGVATTSAGTTWATANEVGMITGALARWTGSTWRWTSFPVSGQYHALNGIATGPHGAAFIVGTNNNAPSPPLSMKLSGGTWKKVTVSAPKGSGLNAVTIAPRGRPWAAGATGGAHTRTMIVRWNGRAWNRVASPSPGSDGRLLGVRFAAASDGWAVGFSYTGSFTPKTMILHWNGHRWS